ncbi:MAG: SPOR domain-containing protein [Spirochaetales bacterium]|nr:SPOR domain-containing protein [Spirochaetales bacterium]
MESKNILLVVISVGLLLLVIFAVGLWWYWPSGKTTNTYVSSFNPDENRNTLDIEQYSREGLPSPSPIFTDPVTSNDMVIGVRDEATVTPVPSLESTPDGYEEASDQGTATPDYVQQETASPCPSCPPSGEQEKTVSIPEEQIKEATAEKTREKSGTEAEDEYPTIIITVDPDLKSNFEKDTSKISLEESPYIESKPRISYTSKKETVKKEKAVIPEKQKVRKGLEYWIQAGSYKSKQSAFDLNDKLKESGLSAQIRTKEVYGVTHYRVRIGPFANQQEAIKFLYWLKKIEGMEDSYISLVNNKG